MPAGEPVLEGFRGAYNTGESFDITCRTSASLPPARINLYINNEEVSSFQVQFIWKKFEKINYHILRTLQFTYTYEI